MPDAADLSPTSSSLSSSLPSKRIDGLDRILHLLDSTVLVQLATLYYLDNTTAFLLLRAIVQVSFVSPRPSPLRPNPQIFPVLGANLLCFISHALASAPRSNEGGSYGYIHGGGVLVDFVGEKDISKWRLILLDLLLLTLQLVMLGIQRVRQTLNDGKEGEATQQDLEAEEAGTRNSSDSLRGEDGIELQALSTVESGDAAARRHPSDKFLRADYLAVDLDIFAALQNLAKSPVTPNTTSVEDDGVIAQLLARLAHRQ